MNYKEALEYLKTIESYGSRPGLERIRELCRRLGDPQEKLKFVHIAGTNGKGSVAAYVSSVLRRAGYRTGRYISPVIFDSLEMIRIGRRNITREAFCQGLEIMRTTCEEMEKEGFDHPTIFEVETVLAFWYFAGEKCDFVVLEAGLGGLLDATNVIPASEVAVLTPVALEHMEYLGKTLEEIAHQKAGIIKPGCSVVSAVQEPSVLSVLERHCEEKRCVLSQVASEKISRVRFGLECQSFDYDGRKKLEIPLAGTFQIENAALAVEVVKALILRGYHVPEKALREGLLQAAWPGRFTLIGKKPMFIVDGAHNPHGAENLARSIETYFPEKRIVFIIGVLRDKEYERVLSLTAGYASQIITVTPPENPRALHAYELAGAASKFHPAVTAADSLEEAVEMAYLLTEREDVIIAFGSLSFLGRMIKIVERRGK